MLHVSLIQKNGCKTDLVEEKQSKKKYLTATIWEEISVGFNTSQTPRVRAMSGYFSIQTRPCCLKTTVSLYLKGMDGLRHKFPQY